MSSESGLGIAIVGTGVRAQDVSNVAELWQMVLEKRDIFTPRIEREHGAEEWFVHSRGAIGNAYEFDAGYFGYSPAEAISIDPQQRVFLELCVHALEDAGIVPSRSGERIGVFAGAAFSSYLLRRVLAGGGQDLDPAFAFLGNQSDHLAARVAYKLGLRGPAVAVQTACSTSLVAVHLACHSLLAGDCDVALAGGVNISLPEDQPYWYSPGNIRSPDGYCRPFSADAAGTVFSNGAGVVVLRRLEDVREDRDVVLAVISGSAINNDGADRVGYTAPGMLGQEDVIRGALAVAGVRADEIGYVEAHGTGTALGDPIEVGALTRAFAADTQRRAFCSLGSIKGNLGHLDTAAGVVGLIKAACVVSRGVLPATLRAEQPMRSIRWEETPFVLRADTSPWPDDGSPRRAGVSAFGIGGTNAHVIVAQAAPKEESPPQAPRPQILALSAHSPASFRARAAALRALWAAGDDSALASQLRELHVARAAHAIRASTVVSTTADAVAWLDRVSEHVPARFSERGATVFLCPGQAGDGLAAMFDALNDFPSSRNVISQAESILSAIAPELPPLSLGVRDPAFKGNTAAEQPWLVALTVAAATLWRANGVPPQIVLGHSVGEFAAACIAGGITLRDALALTAERGRAMAKFPGGAMLAARLSEEAAREFIDPGVHLSAVNAADQVVFSGSEDRINALSERLGAAGIPSLRLRTHYAFHSPQCSAGLERFTEVCRTITTSAPEATLVSTVDGNELTAEALRRPEHWLAHATGAVRFDRALATATSLGGGVYIDLGPTGALAKLVPARGNALAIPAMSANRAAILGALAHAWEAGLAVVAEETFEGARRSSVPAYPFERTSFDWAANAHRSAAKPEPAPSPPPSRQPVAVHGRGWRGLALPARPTPIGARRHWLLLDDGSELGGALAEELHRRGQVVTKVIAGDSYERVARGSYRVRIGERADAEALSTELRAMMRIPDYVLCTWTRFADAEQTGGAPSEESLLRRTRGLFGAELIATTLAHAPQTGGHVGVSIITEDAWAVRRSRGVVPAARAIGVLAQVLETEDVRVRFRVFDSARGVSVSRIAHLAVEASLRSERVVALRRDDGYVPEIVVANANANGNENAFANDHGVVIFGALGGIGSSLTRYALSGSSARVVGVSRASATRSEELEARRQSRRQEFAGFGDRYAERAIDTTRAGSITALLRELRETGVTVDTIVHASGSASHGLLRLRGADSVAEELHAALLESEALVAAAAAHGVRRLIMTTSAASWSPSFGQGVYAARHAAFDAIAERVPEETCEAVAIAWDTWSEVGMAAEGSVPSDLAGLAKKWLAVAMSPEEALAAFEPTLRNGRPNVLVAARSIEALLGRVTIADAERLDLPLTRMTIVRERPSLETEYVAPMTEAELRIAEIWSDVLGFTAIGVHDDFLELGGHSLLAVQLASEIRRSFDVKIALSELFENRTIAAVALLVEQKIIEQIT